MCSLQKLNFNVHEENLFQRENKKNIYKAQVYKAKDRDTYREYTV